MLKHIWESSKCSQLNCYSRNSFLSVAYDIPILICFIISTLSIGIMHTILIAEHEAENMHQ
jgi:hypothetical protein